MRTSFHSLILATLFCACISQQASADMQDVKRHFRHEHPQARFYGTEFHQQGRTSDGLGTASTIYGSRLSSGATPFDSARKHAEEVRDLIGGELGDLLPAEQPDGKMKAHPIYDRRTQGHKFTTLRFDQYHDGIPVFRSGVGFLVRNEKDNPLVMSTFELKDLTGLDRRSAGKPDKPFVTSEMLSSVRRLMGDRPTVRAVVRPGPEPEIRAAEEQLVIWAGTDNVSAAPELALQFVATRGSIRTFPDYEKLLVLASVATGETLYSETLIHNLDVSGNVSGRATDGLNALECDPETTVGLPYIQAEVLGGNSTFADANGGFTIPHGGSSAVTVRSPLRGRWFEVFDQAAGGATPTLDQPATPPGPADFLHNPAPSQEFSNANVNAYYEANVVRDYTLSYVPTFPVVATQQSFNINTNINSSCNAFYDGSSINFYRKAGNCNNTAFSDVVHHEYGHHLVNVTGNGQGQFGEGTGDCLGVLIQDEPVNGQGFFTCGAGIRDADNTHQYPCTGGIHDCGRLLSGCVWSLRNELIVTEPAAYRDIGASLFLNMLVVRGQMFPGNATIGPEVTILYLELDDDDGYIGNGTPHYQEIAAAFGEHNLDAPALDVLEFVFPDGRPEAVSSAGGVVEFTVEVRGMTGAPRPGSGVLSVDRGSGIETFPLSERSPNVYEVVFPASDCGATLSYYLSAETTSGETVHSPADAPAGRYSAISLTTPTAIPPYDDTDGDGTIDPCDADDDNDGVPDAGDVRPRDPDRCEDRDADDCDDCSVGTDDFGPLADNDPDNDGADADGDGDCDAGDADDDNDGVVDGDDVQPGDPDRCQDVDADTCDDCAVGTDDWGPQSDNDIADDGPDADADGLCDAGDAIYFSVAQLQFGIPILYPQNVYHDDPPGPGGIGAAFPTQLPGSVNLDALDVVDPDTYKFSVTSPAFVFAPGGPVILSPANVYVRGAGGTITVDLDWSAEGINLSSLNALDMVDADTHLFSVAAAQVAIDGAGGFRVLYPSRVYSFDRTTGAIDEVLDASVLGMANVDGVDLLPDGRIALSPAAQGIAQLPGGATIVHPARVYITDPGAAGPNLIEAYNGPLARLLGIDGFTLIVPEAP
ncbi:MAG: M4 family metallopeptidase [bacterium]|nr:M4 family metallopeptidase [bacterium]